MKRRKMCRASIYNLFAAWVALLLPAMPAFAQNNLDASAALARVQPLPQKATVRVALGGGNIYPLAMLYALDKGYFAHANLDVKVFKYSTAAFMLAPMLARGDLDIVPQTPSPSFFNLIAQGFGAKAVSVFSTTKAGRIEEAWMVVSSDKVDQIHQLSDLRGRVIEAGPAGATVNFLVLNAVKAAGLTPGKDVTFLNRGRTSADFFTLAKTRSQDVISMIEPSATQAEVAGYGRRWKGMADIVPWLQPLIMVASQQFIDKSRPALRKFLEVYLLTGREIDANNGAWTDDLLRLATTWTGLDADLIRKIGGVSYLDPNGEVSLDSLERADDIWVAARELQQKVKLDDVVDNRPVQDVLQEIGRIK
jgi:ABC-type nitrate/sulfonate/bicarbonate transport system substrate-binding protein